MELVLCLELVVNTQYVLIIFWLNHAACGILVPQPEIESMPLAVEAWSLNHWTIREVFTL